MKAIIFDGKETYASPIFAIQTKGFGTQVLAFDKDYSAIKRIKMWHPFRQVFIVEWTDFPHKSGRWQGYDWVLQDAQLQFALRSGKPVSIDHFPKFKDFSEPIQLPEWFEIQNDQDIASLMGVSLNFHDSMVMHAEKIDDALEIVFDTSWGCYITVRFLDVLDANIINQVGLIYDSEMKFEKDGIRWNVTDGEAGWVNGADFDAYFGEPFIHCKRVLWKIDILDKPHLRYHRNYANLEELHEDLRRWIPDAALENGKITLSHGQDRMEIVPVSLGYRIYINGEMDLDDCEDQDIFDFALEFAFPPRLPPETPALWEYSPSKFYSICHTLQYASIGVVILLLFGLIMALTGNILWQGYFILFGGTAVLTELICVIALLKQERIDYVITATYIHISYPERFCTASFSEIEKISISHSLLCKGSGTIKFKRRKGPSLAYRFAHIPDVDQVYDLLMSLWAAESRVPNPEGE